VDAAASADWRRTRTTHLSPIASRQQPLTIEHLPLALHVTLSPTPRR
jgi:hypothetical protein